MEWRLLGPPERRVAGGSDPVGRRPRAVLEVLLVEANRPCSVDRLIDELWPEAPPKTARNSIQRFVADVRNALGDERDRLVTVDGGYLLRVEPGELDVDVVRTERAVAELTERPAEAAELLRRALARFGELDESAALTPSGRAAVAEHTDLQVQLHEERMQAELAAGASSSIVDELSTLVRHHPYRERLTAQLMTAMARSGQRVAALRAYDALRRRLGDDIGIEPSSDVQQLHRTILDGAPDDIAAPGRDAAATATTPRTGERSRRATIIGRDELVDQVENALDTHQLVTLTGPGGVGKTTLANELQRREQRRGGSATVVLLADVKAASTMLETVAAAVDLVVDGDDAESLQTTIAQRVASAPSLLVLDNAEHLVDAVADLVDEVLANDGPGRLLVTSRERLAVIGEHVVQVEPLTLPDDSLEPADSPAVQLFAQRAAAVGSHQVENLLEDPDVAAICRAVDGLPLGIELAAARLAIATPRDVLERMRQPLTDVGRSRRSARQRSMEALLDWSWDLLDDDERSLLIDLAVFSGWPLAAVEFLHPDDGFDLLVRLTDKSLVRADRSGDEMRYSMLETIKQYCDRRMDDERHHDACGRHAEWVLSHARAFTPAESSAVAAAHQHLVAEMPNVLAALDWLEAHGCQRDHFDLMARASGTFAHAGPVVEGMIRCTRADEALEAPCPVHRQVHRDDLDRDRRGFLVSSLAGLAHASGELASSIDARLRATRLMDGDPFDWIIDAPGQLAGGMTIMSPDGRGMDLLADIEPLIDQTRSAALNRAQFLTFRADGLMKHRRYAEAAELFQQVVAMSPPPGRALLLSEIGLLTALMLLGEHDEARSAAAEVRSQPTTDPWHYAIDVSTAVAVGIDDAAAGAARLEAVLGPESEQVLTGRANDVRTAAAVLAWHAGEVDECVRLLAENYPRMPVFACWLVEYVDGRPHEARTDAAWREHWSNTLTARYVAQYQDRDGWIRQRAEPDRLRQQLRDLGTS